MARKIEKAKNGNYICPHCGSDSTFSSGNFTFTTDDLQIFPYWCQTCNMPFHVEMRNGKAVGESEF